MFRPYRKGMGPTFSLTMWDTGRRNSLGKWLLGYSLTMHDKYTGPGCSPSFRTVLFEGQDYGCSPLHAIDSDASVEGLMSFLTLLQATRTANTSPTTRLGNSTTANSTQRRCTPKCRYASVMRMAA